MKKVKLKIPLNLEGQLASWLIDNNINVIFSYLIPGDLFTPDNLVVVVIIETGKEQIFKPWEKYSKTI